MKMSFICGGKFSHQPEFAFPLQDFFSKPVGAGFLDLPAPSSARGEVWQVRD